MINFQFVVSCLRCRFCSLKIAKAITNSASRAKEIPVNPAELNQQPCIMQRLSNQKCTSLNGTLSCWIYHRFNSLLRSQFSSAGLFPSAPFAPSASYPHLSLTPVPPSCLSSSSHVSVDPDRRFVCSQL